MENLRFPLLVFSLAFHKSTRRILIGVAILPRDLKSPGHANGLLIFESIVLLLGLSNVTILNLCSRLFLEKSDQDRLGIPESEKSNRMCSRDVINFSNYPHQAYNRIKKEVLNLYLFATFKLNNGLRLETSAFRTWEAWWCVA